MVVVCRVFFFLILWNWMSWLIWKPSETFAIDEFRWENTWKYRFGFIENSKRHLCASVWFLHFLHQIQKIQNVTFWCIHIQSVNLVLTENRISNFKCRFIHLKTKNQYFIHKQNKRKVYFTFFRWRPIHNSILIVHSVNSCFYWDSRKEKKYIRWFHWIWFIRWNERKKKQIVLLSFSICMKINLVHIHSNIEKKPYVVDVHNMNRICCFYFIFQRH